MKSLPLSYLRRRPLGTVLNVLLLGLGIATIVVLLLLSRQVEENLTRDAEGINLVVGAKGSPLQLILSSIYHVDAPTGNIPVAEAQQIMTNPMVKKAIPLALGDNYQGYRIVGTTAAYPEHYGAVPAEGRLWDGTLEVTAGAQVAQELNMSIGGEVVSSHGFGDGDAHGDHPMTVVGILEPTGTVVDRLLLTSVETIWEVHGAHASHDDHDDEHHDDGEHSHDDHGDDHDDHDGEHDDDHSHDDHSHDDDHDHEGEHQDDHSHNDEGHDHEGDHSHDEEHQDDETTVVASAPPPGPPGLQIPGMISSEDYDPSAEYTSLLIEYATPMAAATLPRFINTQTNMQAAAPAFQTARLLGLLGFGLDAFRVFGFVLIAVAALSLFIGLYNALKDRTYDIAILRSMGASRGKVMQHVLTEGLLLALGGALLGLVIGHLAAEGLGQFLETSQGVSLTGATFVPEELLLVGLAVVVGAVAALLPAVLAYRTDISGVLARG